MTQHTPGPWTVEPMPHPHRWLGWQVRGPSGIYVGGKLITPRINTLNEPDARLIAAAPDQNDALKVALHWLLDSDRAIGEYDNVVKIVQAAIAKAVKEEQK